MNIVTDSPPTRFSPESAKNGRRFWLEWLAYTLVMLLGGGYVAYQHFAQYKALIRGESLHLTTQVRTVERNLGRQLLAADRALRSLRDDLPQLMAMGEGRIALLRHLQALVAAMPGVRGIAVLNASGIVLASNRQELVGQNFKGRDHFLIARRGGDPTKLYLSKPYQALLGGYSISASRILTDRSGAFAGTVALTLDPEYFEVLLDSVRYAPDVRITLVHGEGNAIYRMPDPQGVIGIDMARPETTFMLHMLGGQSESVYTESSRSMLGETLVVFRTLLTEAVPLDQPLVISAGREYPGFLGSWRSEAYEHAVLFAASSLGAALALVLLQRRRRAHLRINDERRRADSELHRSEEFIRGLLAAVPDGIITHLNGKIEYVNEAALRMIGEKGTDAVIGRDLSEFIPQGYRTMLNAGMARIKSGEPTPPTEVQILRKDGTALNVDVSGARIGQGSEQRVVVIHDISTRKQADAALEASIERHRRLSEAPVDAIFISENGVCVEQNRTAELMFGYSDDEALGRMGTDWVVPEDRERVMRNMIAGYEEPYEVTALRKDGSRFPATIRGRMMEYRGRRVRATSLSDITLRKAAESALRDSDIRFRTVVEQAGDGFELIDSSGRIIDVNHTTCRQHGYSRDEMLSLTLRDIVPNLDWHRFRSRFDGRSVVPDTVETRHRRKDGTEFTVEVAISIISLSGEPHCLSLTRDVTERRRAEAALRESQDRLAAVFHGSPVAILVRRMSDGAIVDVNDAALQWYGVAREDVIGRTTAALDGYVLPEQRDSLQRQVQEQGYVDHYPIRVRRPSGELRTVEVSGRIVEIDRERCLVATLVDVTERDLADATLRRSAEQYRTLTATTTDGFWVVGKDARLIDVNDAYCRMTGYTRDELLGMSSIDEVIQIDGDEPAFARITRIMQAGALHFEVRHRCRDGRFIEVEVSATHVPLAGCVFSFMRDVTERKRLEKAMRQAHALESLGTLAGGIAHDFNNILAAIRGNTDLAMADLGSMHEAYRSLEEIRKASVRASELVRRIMAFGRPKDVRFEVVDVGVVVGEVLNLLRSTVPAAIALRKDFSVDAPHVLADPSQIHEAVVNLTTNAVYAIGPRAGAIDYRLALVELDETTAQRVPGTQPGSYACLSVSDSGCGIDAQTMERIFDAFYTTKPQGEGSGLGLSMVHGTMRSHGGAVTVESIPGKGASFHLYFPASVLRAADHSKLVSTHRDPLGAQRILYLDDDEALVFLAKRVLSRRGHEVTGHSNPLEALQAYKASPESFDLVVTDLSMPDMSGFDFSREVLKLRPEMPILMTTGYVGAEDEGLAQKIGIRELILKPVTIDELVLALDRILVGDTTLD